MSGWWFGRKWLGYDHDRYHDIFRFLDRGFTSPYLREEDALEGFDLVRRIVIWILRVSWIKIGLFEWIVIWIRRSLVYDHSRYLRFIFFRFFDGKFSSVFRDKASLQRFCLIWNKVTLVCDHPHFTIPWYRKFLLYPFWGTRFFKDTPRIYSRTAVKL